MRDRSAKTTAEVYVTARRLLIVVMLMIGLQGCGGAGAVVDTIDRAALKEGGATTRTLKFWMKERGIKGDGLADNVHFDDGANHRIVLWYGTDLKDKVAALVQGTPYKVTFTYAAGDELVYGTMTAVE